MKKFLIIAIINVLALSFGLKAQITITQSDAPLVGESWTEIIDDRIGVHSVNPAGSGQTWDYSTNFVAQDTDYVNFVSPALLWPPLNTYFPNSNLAFDDPVDSSVVYLKVNASGIYADGSSSYAPSFPIDSLDWNPDLLFFPFPFTFNDMRNHTSKFEIATYDSSLNATLKFKSYIISDFMCDGYGSITTPQTTFSNVIRVKSINRSIDSTFIDTSGTGNFLLINTSGFDTSITYQHLQNGDPIIVFTLEVLADDATVEEAFYASLLTTGVNHGISYSQGYVYPNPVMRSDFHIRIQHKDAYELRIYSIEGKEIYNTSVKGVNDIKLELPLKVGNYLYQIINKEGNILESAIFYKVN